MKRVLMILLAAMLLVTALPTSALAASTRTVYISSTGSGSLNLRSGPGKGYAPKGYIHHGDQVTVLSHSGEWSKVRTESGRTGWIKTKYVDGTTKSLGTGTKTVRTSGGSLNLRSGPGTGYSVRGSVYDGAKVKVLNTEDDWVRVSVQSTGQTGWIKVKYLSGSSGGSSSSGSGSSSSGSSGSGSSSSASSRVYHVTSVSLNLRTGPGTGYGVVDALSSGTAFRVLESSGNWFNIRTFDGVTGWISQNYAATGATATVTATNLNMRSSASASASLVKSLPYGTRVEVTHITGNWAKVSSGGKTGYVSLNYLDL